jgi:hypothetical protein
MCNVWAIQEMLRWATNMACMGDTRHVEMWHVCMIQELLRWTGYVSCIGDTRNIEMEGTECSAFDGFVSLKLNVPL